LVTPRIDMTMFCINWGAVTAVSTAALVVTGAGAIYFAYRQIENERVYRRIENLEEQLGRFDADPIANHRKTLAEARLDASKATLRSLDAEDPPVSTYEILNFFEHIAFLVDKGHLNVFDVWHTFDYWATAYYYDFRSVIEVEQRDDCSSYCDFVKLITQLREVQIKETGRENTWLPDELVGFYSSELEDVKKPGRRRSSRSGHQELKLHKAADEDAKTHGSGR
jgi:hypothetical protein